jgi:beta-lactamase superfamily II metal-dependent hydrolase
MVLYLKKFESGLRKEKGKGAYSTHLIWGDPVTVLEEDGDYAYCSARTKKGWIKKADLGTEGLLELYIIDVGQGDSVLIRTPDNKWHIVDGGNAIPDQMVQKGAANFLRWKFQDELGIEPVPLENVILTHPDLDHFGGLIDIFAGDLRDGRTFKVAVKNYYHSGIGKYLDAPETGGSIAGRTDPFPKGNHGIPESGQFIVELLDGKDSFRNPARKFDSDKTCLKKKTCFESFAALVATVPEQVRRISRADGYLPGYAPGENDVCIAVLAPVLEKIENGKKGLRNFDEKNASVTVNGNSVVLRIGYGNARILLTGDLNTVAQKLLMSYLDPEELSADVYKACHHGSDDVNYEFLAAVMPRATVISSGDNESYAHPRPVAMGAVGRYGRDAKSADGKTTYPPMVYSTELARSIELVHASGAKVREGQGAGFQETDVDDVQVVTADWKNQYRPLKKAFISAGLRYGLVNIRTDGKNILCATMTESGTDFDCRIFQAGVDA